MSSPDDLGGSGALRSPLEARLQLITGKGGVGRTTTTLALGQALATRGERVLMLEVRDAESELGEREMYHARADSMLGRAVSQSLGQRGSAGFQALGPEPTLVSEGLWAAQLVSSVGHEEFLSTIIPSGRLVRAALESQALARFLRSAPSMHELGIYYHLSRLVDDERFDRVVVDLPASGHTLALTELPERMARILKRGRLVDALRSGVAALSDPRRCALWVVTLNEELPITEALELERSLDADGVTVSGVIINRTLPRPLDERERATLERARDALVDMSSGSEIDPALDSALDGELSEVLNIALRDHAWRAALKGFRIHLTLPELAMYEARAEHVASTWL